MKPLLLLLLAVQGAPQATPVRVADAACARCHSRIYQTYLQTPMANASGAAVDKLMQGTYLHAASGVAYTIEDPGGVPTLSWRETGPPGQSGQEPLSYFLGSGHLGITWLYSVDGYLFESPVAWYAPSHGLDMKPGLAQADQMLPSLPVQSECLRCHMSAVQRSDAGSINRYTGLPFLHTGITCEACHGDTEQHVLSEGKAPVVNPASLDAERRDSVCISCHLEGDVTVERARQSALDYRPRDRISDYLAYYVYAQSDPEARGVSEVEQFNQSACKRMSGASMSCTSCHDPHFTPAPSERVSWYRSKCLVCHSGNGFAASHHPENPDCTACHMPHNDAQNIPHVAWTDHRILRIPQPPGRQHSDATAQLVPIFSPGATHRDLGMAYYVALLNGNRAVEPSAWSVLHAVRDKLSLDPAALDALGELDAERGNDQDAEREFRAVLALQPDDVNALSNLGTLLAREGHLVDAIALLRQAWDRNRDLPGIAINLARVQCLAGDSAGEVRTLNSALHYNPGVSRIELQLDGPQPCGSAGAQAPRP